VKAHLRALLGLVALLAAGVLLAACGGGEEQGSGQQGGSAQGGQSGQPGPQNAIQPVANAPQQPITVGSKNFDEQYILGEIYAQALKAGGFNVKKELDLGSEVVAFEALKQGEVDAYPEYTGTALTSFFDQKLEEVPRDPSQAYEEARMAYAKEGVTALPPTPFENSYRLGMTKETAQKLGNPQKISDLQGKAQNLSVTGFPECEQRTDCLIGVQRAYGLEFGEFVSSESPYQVLDSGEADVAFVFTTDGELATGKYQVLEDDRNFFPPYNVSLTMRDQAAKMIGQPGIDLIRRVQEPLTDEVMQELNSRVSVDAQQPEKVAREYLTQFGFIRE